MTLLGLWLVPVVISLYFHFWRFVGVWVLFSGVTGYVLYTCISKRIDRATPRRVSTHAFHLLSPFSTSILAHVYLLSLLLHRISSFLCRYTPTFWASTRSVWGWGLRGMRCWCWSSAA